MAGIYIHIPFCKQACHYCDFHFSTSLKQKSALVDAIVQEIKIRADYTGDEAIQTLYFGGGTPSLLTFSETEKIVTAVKSHFLFAENVEVTFEANPDDLNPAKLQELVNLGVNRLSIGIQSFSDAQLRWMNRAHSGNEAVESVLNAQKAGIDNISIDLIYGLPQLSPEDWIDDLRRATALGVTHVSAYCLTVEPATALGHRVKKGQEKPVDEEAAATQFAILRSELAEAGFEHYEVSNFAKAGYYSRHNTAYWQGTPYIGLGPSAHSFDKVQRSWNISNNALYISALRENKIPQTKETLSRANQINETLMTGLRTKWGVNPAEIRDRWHYDLLSENAQLLSQHEKKGLVSISPTCLKLTPEGLFMADGIASDLFIIEDDEILNA